MTGDELDDLWKVGPGLETLDHAGARVEIQTYGENVHYVVNGRNVDHVRVPEGQSPGPYIAIVRRRVAAQWGHGVWPPA